MGLSNKLKNLLLSALGSPEAANELISAIESAANSAGSNKQIQFNDSGVSGASSNFTFDKTLNSMTMGNGNIVSGSQALALGFHTTASGNNSISAGANSIASGGASVALGINTLASAQTAFAIGLGTIASGVRSFATGSFTTASGIGSVSFGTSSNVGIVGIASGTSAFSKGADTVSSGEQSESSGIGTIAQSDNQLAVGQYNTAQGTPTSPAPSDQIFTVGIGTDDTHRADGFYVKRDGSVFCKNGSSGSFVATGKTITVTNGIITSIV